MCHATSSSPPIAVATARPAATSELRLESAADSVRFAGFLARPERPSGVGVLVLPDNRGLSPFYEKVAAGLAGEGHVALAIDYFARTAGPDYRQRSDRFADPSAVMAHLQALDRRALYGDVEAAVAYLRAPSAGACQVVVSLGFCVGGRFAFFTAATRFGLDGVIGLYGYPDQLMGADGPLQAVDELTAPVLGLWGGADEGIPADLVAEFDAALSAAGTEHEFVTYPGAPHAFFESGRSEFADASADAWRRVLAFVEARRSREPKQVGAQC